MEMAWNFMQLTSFFDIIQKKSITLVGRGYYTHGIMFHYTRGKTLLHHVGITTLWGKTLDLWLIITVFQIITLVGLTSSV